MKKSILFYLRKLATIAAIFVIAFAIFVVSLRLFSPLLNHYRSDFEKWASDILHLPVQMQTVSVDWYLYQPAITFNQTRVLNAETNEPILEIQKVRMLLSVPLSIWHWRPVISAILISGTDITIHQNAQGELSMQGFSALEGFNQPPFKKETKFMSVLSWLATPPNLILHNIDIRYETVNGKTRYVTLYHLKLKNEDTDHAIYGKAVLHQQLPITLTLAIHWQGMLSEIEKIKAESYAYVSGLSLSEWLKDMTWKNWQVESGLVSAKIWAFWENNQFQRIQTKFQAYDLNFYHVLTKTHQQLTRVSGNIGWVHQGNEWIAAGNDLLLDFPDHLWPTNHFYIAVTVNDKGDVVPHILRIGYADLNDIERLLPYTSPFLTTNISSVIAKLKLQGFIQDLSLTFPANLNDWMQTKVVGNIVQFSAEPWQAWPGFTNLTASLTWDGQSGQLNIFSKRLKIIKPDIFTSPLSYDNVDGDLAITRKDDGRWDIAIKNLQLQDSYSAQAISGTVQLTPDYKPTLDLTAHFALNNIVRLSQYLPMKMLNADLQQWVRQAFLSGEITQSTILVQGPLSAFPFDNNTGRVDVTAEVKNVNLRYDAAWPTINHIQGTVNFHNRQMQIKANADTGGIALNHINAIIPYLGENKPQDLILSGDPINIDLETAIQFINTTPLKKKFDKLLSHVLFKGNSQLNLQLMIPLQNPDLAKVLGKLTMANVEMTLLPYHLAISNLNGTLQVTENAIASDKISGMLFDQPINLQLSTSTSDVKNPVIKATFNTQLAFATLPKWISLPLGQAITGQTSVQGEMTIRENQPVTLTLTSDLVGATIHSPNELAKTAEESRSFSSVLTFYDHTPLHLKISYNKFLRAALVLNLEKNKWKLGSAVLHFGEGNVDYAKENGLFITGNLKTLTGQQISRYINQPSASVSDLPLNLLRNIDITIGQLNLNGQVFEDVDVSLTPEKALWKVDLKSNDMVGELEVPVPLTNTKTVMMRFKRLDLHQNELSSNKTSGFLIKNFPPIDFKTDELTYDDRPLGHVSFETKPNDKGMTINSLKITSPNMTLYVSGAWTQSTKNQLTELSGMLMSDHLTELVRNLRIDNHNFIASTGKFRFKLSWPDAPYVVNPDRINGELNVDIGKGQVLDIGKESNAKMDIGRMLNLFSLQTIPRRLSLDFSDLMQKGYSFDNVTGDFHFRDGNANTTNLQFDGPVAKVSIQGRIGFKQKDFDLIFQVTPYLTSSIPVAAALITVQPLVGIAAWAFTKVIGSQVSKVATYSYSVVGPWDNPKWESVR